MSKTKTIDVDEFVRSHRINRNAVVNVLSAMQTYARMYDEQLDHLETMLACDFSRFRLQTLDGIEVDGLIQEAALYNTTSDEDEEYERARYLQFDEQEMYEQGYDA